MIHPYFHLVIETETVAKGILQVRMVASSWQRSKDWAGLSEFSRYMWLGVGGREEHWACSRLIKNLPVVQRYNTGCKSPFLLTSPYLPHSFLSTQTRMPSSKLLQPVRHRFNIFRLFKNCFGQRSSPLGYRPSDKKSTDSGLKSRVRNISDSVRAGPIIQL